NIWSLVAFVALFVLIWVIKAVLHPRFERWTLVFPIVVLFLISNKVYSSQYSLWLLPLFALALQELAPFVAFEIADLAVFTSRFWFFGYLSRVWGVPERVFEFAIGLRIVALIWCLVRWVRRRPETAGEPAT